MYFGSSLDEVAKKYSMNENTVLEMAFHRYLPKDEIMKFFEVIRQLNVTQKKKK